MQLRKNGRRYDGSWMCAPRVFASARAADCRPYAPRGSFGSAKVCSNPVLINPDLRISGQRVSKVSQLLQNRNTFPAARTVVPRLLISVSYTHLRAHETRHDL